jgi:hypothetical protein
MKSIPVLLAILSAPAAAVAQEKLDPWSRADVARPGEVWITLEAKLSFFRDLEEDRLGGTGPVAGSATEQVEIQSDAAFLRGAYSIYSSGDNTFAVEAYALLGFNEMTIEGDVSGSGNPTGKFEANGKSDLALGLGTRARVYRDKDLTILGQLGFVWSKSDARVGHAQNLGLDLAAGQTATQDFDLEYFLLEFSAYASYRLRMGTWTLSPYAGFRVSMTDVELDGTQTFSGPSATATVNYAGGEEEIFGIIVGAEATLSEDLNLLAEINILDEFAITVGAGWRF